MDGTTKKVERIQQPNKNLFNIEAEQIILGTIILNNDYLSKVSEILKVNYFYEPSHKKIYEQIISTIQKSSIVADSITLKTFFNSDEMLKTIGGDKYLSVLLSFGAGIVDIRDYATIIKDLALKRELVLIGEEIVNTAYEKSNTIPAKEQLKIANEKLFELENENGVEVKTQHLTKFVINELKDLKISMKNPEYITKRYIKTGFYDFDKKFKGFKLGELILLAGRPAMGKALKMNAKILTNNGWILNKDLKIGDKLSSIDGKDSIITGIFPQGGRQLYKILFSDGRFVECDGNHLWEISSSRFKGNKVLNTLEIIKKLKTKRYYRRISIPMFQGNYGIKKDFIIHPYILGVLLGDGDLGRGACWTKPDNFILNKIKGLLPQNHKISKSVVEDRHNIITGSQKIENIILKELKNLKLFKKKSYEKFIPKKYFHTSKEQRLELLNGLLDTDGSVDKLGSIEYSTSSKQLSIDVQQLIFSLGFKCTRKEREVFLNNKKMKNNFRLLITGKNKNLLFCTKIKKNRLITNKISRPLTIISIKKTTFEECQCIKVSHSRALFITDNYIATHNSTIAINIIKNVVMQDLNVIFFSLEMSASEISTKILANCSRINSEDIEQGAINNEDFEKIMKSYEENFDNKNFFINDKPEINCNYIRNSLKKFKRNEKLIDFIVIDYLQIMFLKNKQNPNIELGLIMNRLKTIAKEFNIVILLLSQLNRGVENREDKRPFLQDIRDSGTIEQISNMIIFCYRDEYYLEKDLERLNKNSNNQSEIKSYEIAERKLKDCKNKLELLVRKNRRGRTGNCVLNYEREFSLINDIQNQQYKKQFRGGN